MGLYNVHGTVPMAKARVLEIRNPAGSGRSAVVPRVSVSRRVALRAERFDELASHTGAPAAVWLDDEEYGPPHVSAWLDANATEIAWPAAPAASASAIVPKMDHWNFAPDPAMTLYPGQSLAISVDEDGQGELEIGLTVDDNTEV
jgi:hypothetical protein